MEFKADSVMEHNYEKRNLVAHAPGRISKLPKAVLRAYIKYYRKFPGCGGRNQQRIRFNFY